MPDTGIRAAAAARDPARGPRRGFRPGLAARVSPSPAGPSDGPGARVSLTDLPTPPRRGASLEESATGKEEAFDYPD